MRSSSELSFPRKRESPSKMREHRYYTYIMASRPQGALYIGVTGDLIKRVYEHKNGITKGYTEKYKCNMLVWYEEYSDVEQAILREKRMKKWNRDWKIELIERDNPEWRDLYPLLVDTSLSF